MIKKPKKSVLINYNKKVIDAPCVSGVASGKEMCDEVGKLANRYGVPVRKNSLLVEQLQDIEPETVIEEYLFEDIANAFISDIE